jgi:hypothetical protein
MATDNIYKTLEQIGQQVVDEMKAIIMKGYMGRPAVATGNLLNSIQYDVQVNGGVWTLVVEYADYGKWVNNGRNPGKFPPKAAIEQWVRLKGLPDKAVWPIMMKIKKGGFYSQKIGQFNIRNNQTGQMSQSSVYSTPVKGLHFTDPLTKNLELQSLSKELGIAFHDYIQEEFEKMKKEIAGK